MVSGLSHKKTTLLMYGGKEMGGGAPFPLKKIFAS